MGGLQKKEKKFAEKFNLEVMLDAAIDMLGDMSKAVKERDTELARKTIKKDVILNDHGKAALEVATELIKDNPDETKQVLRLYSVTRRIERIGDLIKNLGEEVVFHVEAKVIKHKKSK